MTDGIEDGLGGLQFEVVLCLLLCWVIIFSFIYNVRYITHNIIKQLVLAKNKALFFYLADFCVCIVQCNILL